MPVIAFLSFLLLAAPITLAVALVRGFLFFWPAMVLVGALHSYVPEVPAISWEAAFFLVAVFTILAQGSPNTTTGD
jgi:hypothetical protein